MLQMLQRLQQHDNDDEAELAETASGSADESDNELSEHIQQKLIMAETLEEVEISAEDLSPAELQAFRRAVASGHLNKFVDAWAPWWHLPEAATAQLSASGTSRISIQDAGVASEASGSVPAAPPSPLPLLGSLTKAVPSPKLQWQLLDTLYAYCFVMRLYNGEPRSDPQEAVASVLQVSSTLQASATPITSGSRRQLSHSSERQAVQAAMPGTASEAFLQCIERVCSPTVTGALDRATAIGLLQDVATVVKHGRSVVVLALYDLQRLVLASQDCCAHGGMSTAVVQTQLPATDKQSQTQKSFKSTKKVSAAKARIRGVLQKLRFLLSWANELPGTVYADLGQAVVDELKHHSSTLSVPKQKSELLISDAFVKSTMHQHSSSPPYPVIHEL
ncbi:hypothetical protein ABBQ32_006128 [Trebouxia sp. C0010 RCD-2024]